MYVLLRQTCAQTCRWHASGFVTSVNDMPCTKTNKPLVCGLGYAGKGTLLSETDVIKLEMTRQNLFRFAVNGDKRYNSFFPWAMVPIIISVFFHG